MDQGQNYDLHDKERRGIWLGQKEKGIGDRQGDRETTVSKGFVLPDLRQDSKKHLNPGDTGHSQVTLQRNSSILLSGSQNC